MAALISADMAPSLFTFVKSVTLRHRIITSRFLHGCVLYKRVKIVATRIPLRAGFISSFNWNKSCIDLVFPNNNKKNTRWVFLYHRPPFTSLTFPEWMTPKSKRMKPRMSSWRQNPTMTPDIASSPPWSSYTYLHNAALRLRVNKNKTTHLCYNILLLITPGLFLLKFKCRKKMHYWCNYMCDSNFLFFLTKTMHFNGFILFAVTSIYSCHLTVFYRLFTMYI